MRSCEEWLSIALPRPFLATKRAGNMPELEQSRHANTANPPSIPKIAPSKHSNAENHTETDNKSTVNATLKHSQPSPTPKTKMNEARSPQDGPFTAVRAQLLSATIIRDQHVGALRGFVSPLNSISLSHTVAVLADLLACGLCEAGQKMYCLCLGACGQPMRCAI